MADSLPRTPEPELMDSPEQVGAYAAADFAESNQAFVDRLAGALADRPAGRLIDLGCGPADICIRAARGLHPGWRLVGLDAGPNMLECARRAVASAGFEDRIELALARLPDTGHAGRAFDCVISNSLLHHLPSPALLWEAVRRLAAAGAYVQVMDLCRPASADRVEALVEAYAGGEPEVLRTDFRNSLRAAWRVEEVREQLDRAGLELACETVSDRHWLVSGRLPGG